MAHLVLPACALLLFVCHTLAASADEWRTRSIYQLLTDRFAVVGDAGVPCDVLQGMRCGGSWKAITGHLDYIQELGFDAVWISPVVSNLEGGTKYGQAYHGYWTRDIHSLNSHFGKADDLRELSSALHSRGMYLMVDVVVNHMALVPNQPGTDIQSNGDFTYSNLTFSDAWDYHPFCWVEDYNNQTRVEQCALGDTNVALVDINTEDPNIVAELNDWIKTLVHDYDIDGIRIDTVKHVRKDFWPEFIRAAGVFSMGEVLIGDVDYLSPYTQVLDSVLDYPTYFALVSAFAKPGGNLSAVADIALQSQQKYKQGVFMTGSFLENHDNPRFQSVTTDVALVKNAMTWNFVSDGIPILYYGQEQGYQGGSDPANREALWLSRFQITENPLASHIQDLNKARKLAISIEDDFLITAMKFVPQGDPSALAIFKPPMLALLTNAGSGGQASWNISGVYDGNEQLEDILSCTALQLDGEGSLVVASDGGMPRVLMPVSAGMCELSEAQEVDTAEQGPSRNSGWVSLICFVLCVALSG